MKVAVLVIGELRNSEFVKNLYDGCDVFVHTDKKYGEPFPAKYQYFDENQERIVDKLINRKGENFHRIIQWLRYHELLKNDLSEYDVVVKVRTDLDLFIDNFYDFLKDKTIEENTLYAIKDIIWYGTCDTIMKTDFYNDIVFYLGMDDVFLPMNYDAILKSDLDTMEFTWLNWKTIIDYTGDIKQEIIDKRENLESEDKNIITYDDYHTQPQTYHRFKSEKFFLHYILERDICIKKLGFDLKFRNRIYG